MVVSQTNPLYKIYDFHDFLFDGRKSPQQSIVSFKLAPLFFMEGQGKLLDTHSAIASSLIIDLGNGIVSFVCVVWTVEKPESESSVVKFIWS